MLSVLRLNFVVPGLDPKQLTAHYKAGIEMARYADENNFFSLSFEEHHGADDGWSPTPLLNAGMMVGATKNVRIIVQALLVPLHDPIRLAEQIAVLDLASGGRVSVVAGLGYRPEEYEAAGKSWKDRGKSLDDSLTAILSAWKGEEFEYDGHRTRSTPVPISPPQALIFVGGSGKPGARRAARFDLPFLPAANLPELAEYYNQQCAEKGVNPFIMMPPEHTSMTHIAEDPEKAWADYGKYFLHEATTYAGWQTPDIHSAVHSHATTAEELRAEGIYEVITPDQCIERAKSQGDFATCVLHPMVGGMPPEVGWESLRLYVDKVLPYTS
ncbi:MAG TPA: LLM class flavin-dependent oxidoreductase [Frankiaceae bacterium]|nr:LLM class flavin-dependent oxidoreductase [Frankiaceae bacterium]